MTSSNASDTRTLRRHICLIAVGIVAGLLTSAALANPVFNNVAAGNVSVQQSPGTTVVNQSSQKAIINWQSFNIGHGESTHFNQPTGGVALNRISPTQGASQIYGSLTATGQLILINPAGVYFGPSAYVNVGGLIASTANISDQNFMNGIYQFSKVGGYAGAIVNEGQIIAAQHGLVALLAPGVMNKGMIQANLGKVILASGDAFTLNFSGDNLINFAITAKTSARGIDKDGNSLPAGISNTGSIFANGGTIILSAQAVAGVLDHVINMEGIAQTQSVYEDNGQIILSGDTDAGIVRVAANLDASGKGAGQTGGNVTITGYNILLDSPTLIDVSGDAGGGNVNIGGNYQGQGPLPNANATVMAPNASILADAITTGNGGNVILWSDYVTKFYGNISAKGGSISGNGGLVETSGKTYLDALGSVNTMANAGNSGIWLLDPADITISAGSDSGYTNISNTFTPNASAASSIINTTTLANALASNNIIITTTNNGASGGAAGNITVADPISWASGNNLTLTAANNIAINAAITIGNSSSATLILNAAGTVTQTAAIGGLGGLTKQGAGTAILSMANTYSGATTVSAGVISVQNNNALGDTTGQTSIASGAAINIDGNGLNIAETISSMIGTGISTTGALRNLANNNTWSGAIVLGAGGARINSDAGTLTITGGVTGAARPLTIGGSGNTSFTTNAIATTTGTLTKAGTGTLTLGAANSYTGATTINNGIVVVQNNTSLGTIGGTTSVASGAAIYIDGDGLAIAEPINTLIGTGISGGGALVNLANNNTWSGAIALGAGGATISSNSDRLSLGSINAAQPLTLTGAGSFSVGGIGNTTALSSLTVNSPIRLNGSNVITTGNQTYNDAVTLNTTTVTLNAGAGNIYFANTIDSFTATARALTLTSSGTKTLNGSVGSTFALNTLTISGGGTTTINGGSIITNGVQVYNGNIRLGADTVLNSTAGGSITFGTSSTLNSSDATAHSLTLTTTGASLIGGVVGGIFPLNNLTVTAGGFATTLNASSVTANGNITFNKDVALRLSDKIVTSNTGSITFGGTLSGAFQLETNSATGTTFNGAVDSSVTNLIVNGPAIANANITTTGNQTYNGIFSFTGTRTLRTIGAGGNISLAQPLSWSHTGSLWLRAGSGTVTLPSSVTATNGTLILTASDIDNSYNTYGTPTALTTAINVGLFDMRSGRWIQINSSLPSFYASDFSVTGNQFIRALGGDGSSGNPYQIADSYGLQSIGFNATALASNYILANNIDLAAAATWKSNAGWTPLGDSTTPFSGSFNGNNYIISNLYIKGGTTNRGFFSFISSTGTVSNLGLTNINIPGASQFTGGLAWQSSGTITNSYTTGTLSSGNQAGGLVGRNLGVIANSYSKVNISSSESNIGGLVGVNTSTGSIINSFATGNVIGGRDSIGGLVGNNSGSITQSYSIGAVSNFVVATFNMGGLVGYNTLSGTITNSYSSSSVSGTGTASGTGTSNVGGLTGYNSGTISTSYSTGAVTKLGGSAVRLGGLVALNDGTINNSYWDTQSSGQTSSNGGSGLTTSQMMTSASYSGWDFATAWNINNGQSYPFLRAFYSTAPRVISGSTSTSGGTAITFAANGAILDTIYTSPNGSYYFLAGNNLISGIDNSVTDGTAVLAYLNSGSIIGNSVAIAPSSNGSLSNLNITANNLTVGTSSASTMSNTSLATAVGSLTSNNILFSAIGNTITIGNNIYKNITFNTTTNTNYNINGNINSTSGATNNSIVFNSAPSVNTSATLSAVTISFLNSLTGNGSLTITGANSSNTLNLKSTSSQLFNISGTNSGTASNIGSFAGSIVFNNIQNITGGNNGNTFNFANNASMSGSLNGSNLSSTNIINLNSYNAALKVMLSTTNDGSIRTMSDNSIGSFTNITHINLNTNVDNTIYTPSGKGNNVYITAGRAGYINDPIYFTGTNKIIGSSGSAVSFLSNATYDPTTGLYTVDGQTMNLSGFSTVSGYTISTPIDISNIIQQSPVSTEQNTATTTNNYNSSWILSGSSVNQNLTTLSTDLISDLDSDMQKVKINPYCYSTQ